MQGWSVIRRPSADTSNLDLVAVTCHAFAARSDPREDRALFGTGHPGPTAV
jgi:hypothetical protein